MTTQRAGTAKMPLSSFVLPIIDNGMKAETPSFEAHQFVRVRRGDAVRRLIQRDKNAAGGAVYGGSGRHAGRAGGRRL